MKHKFGAIRCERKGIKFPSKLERNYYDQLVFEQNAGNVLFFIRQPRFDLPGGIVYLADFLVFYANGNAEFIDTKGKDTAVSILKRKQVEEIYPVKIKIVTKV